MTPSPYIKDYLMTAGPTPVPPLVSQMMAEPILYHRAPAFLPVYSRVLDRLKTVFDTQNDVLCFAASGSGAMDSAFANLVRPGDKVLVTSAGKFGERWRDLAEAYQGRLHLPRRRVGHPDRPGRGRPPARRESRASESSSRL